MTTVPAEPGVWRDLGYLKRIYREWERIAQDSVLQDQRIPRGRTRCNRGDYLSVSYQFVTTPTAVPTHTIPLPCVAPKPEPVIVTCVPGRPPAGDTFEISAVFTVKAIKFEDSPFCWICATPELDPVFTVAMT